MMRVFQSLAVAALVIFAFSAFGVAVVAPHLPPIAGRPDRAFVREFEGKGVELLRVHQSDGAITVRTYSGKDVRGSVSIREYLRESTEPAAADAFSQQLLTTTRQGNALDVTTESVERPAGLMLYADYTIWMPEGASLEIDVANGDVRIGPGAGGVTVSGQNANVQVDRPQAGVVVDTVNGRIRVLDAPDGASLRTVNGNLYAHILGGALYAEATNGAIVAHMLKPNASRFELTTKNGGITVVLSDGCAARVDAVTQNGGVRSDLPLTTPGVSLRGQLHGMIGEDGAALTMESVNGNLWIARASS